jgi:hypothetical protein
VEDGFDYGVSYSGVNEAYSALRQIAWLEEVYNQSKENNKMESNVDRSITELLMKRGPRMPYWASRPLIVMSGAALVCSAVIIWWLLVIGPLHIK